MPKNTGRYSEAEIGLIKNTFAQDDAALKVIRKVLYQIPLSDDEEEIRKILANPDILDVLYKSFLPEITGDEPVNMVMDLWYSVRVKDYTPSQANCFIKARQIFIDYLVQQLEVIEGKRLQGAIDFERLVTKDNLDVEDKYAAFIARNDIISHVEGTLLNLMVLAGNKGSEEIIEIMAKNSSK